MTTRRRLLRQIIAGAAAALAGGAVPRPPAPVCMTRAGEGACPLVVFDDRVAAGRLFAEVMEGRGCAARACAGDVSGLWLSWLLPRWRQGPVALAGLTAFAPFFCFRELAKDQWMHVLWCAPQDPRTGLAEWVKAGAAQICRRAAGNLPPGRGLPNTLRPCAATDALASPLVAWLIGPRTPGAGVTAGTRPWEPSA